MRQTSRTPWRTSSVLIEWLKVKWHWHVRSLWVHYYYITVDGHVHHQLRQQPLSPWNHALLLPLIVGAFIRLLSTLLPLRLWRRNMNTNNNNNNKGWLRRRRRQCDVITKTLPKRTICAVMSVEPSDAKTNRIISYDHHRRHHQPSLYTYIDLSIYYLVSIQYLFFSSSFIFNWW